MERLLIYLFINVISRLRQITINKSMDIQTLFFPTPSIETKIYSPSRFQCTHPSSQFPLLDTRRAKRLGGEGEREVLSSWAWCAFLPHHSTHVRTDRFLTGSVLIDFVDLRAMYRTRASKIFVRTSDQMTIFPTIFLTHFATRGQNNASNHVIDFLINHVSRKFIQAFSSFF